MNVNCPLLPDCTVRTAEPEGPDSTTRAPGSASRLASSTVPVMLPREGGWVSCASIFCAGTGASGSAALLRLASPIFWAHNVEHPATLNDRIPMAPIKSRNFCAVLRNSPHLTRAQKTDPFIIRREILPRSYLETRGIQSLRTFAEALKSIDLRSMPSPE